MEFRTVQGSSIKLLVEALKELTNDVNFYFGSDGVRITAFDNAHCALFHVLLEADKIEEYVCTKPCTVGISLVNMFKLIKNVGVSDELEMKLDAASMDVMEIHISNADKSARWSYKMKLLDIDEQSLSIPEKQYMTLVTMASSEFQKICRDLSIVSDNVRIKCTGEDIVFACEGDIGSCVLEIGKTFPNMKVETGEDDAIDEEFSLRYLCTFAKAGGLCNSVNLFLSPEYPIIVKYRVGDLGTLLYALAPKISGDQMDAE
eukprot:jgi/Mesvir1/19544/Mv18064-RA.1